MSYDRNIDGNIDHLDVVGETALVRGTLQASGPGRVVPWEQLPEGSKNLLAGAELTWSVEQR